MSAILALSGVDRRLRLLLIALTLAGLILASAVVKFAVTAWLALGYPFELDYGEGIVWQQAVNIAAGRGYAPLGVFPAIVYHYPPLYHLALTVIARGGGLDALLAGRLLSLAATLGGAALVARLAVATIADERDRRVRRAAAGTAAALFVTSPTVLFWSSLMRVDMVATFLSLAGLWWTAQTLRGHRRIVPAALAFALAVFTKQTAIFAPLAAFAALWVARPATAWRFAAALARFGLGALALALTVWGGEFLRHVVRYNVNRLDLGRGGMLLLIAGSQIITLTLAVVAAGRYWQRLRPDHRAALRARVAADPIAGVQLLVLANFAIRVATLPMILKSGSSDNYVIDLFAAAAILCAAPVAQVVAMATGGPAPRALVAALVLVGLPVERLRLDVGFAQAVDRAAAARSAAFAARIGRLDGPVVADDMVLLRRAGRPVLLEPAIVAELSHAGLYDEAGYVALIRARRFGGFVTMGERGQRLFDERYSPAVAAAIGAAYPRLERYGPLVLHLPVRPGPAASPRR